MEKLKGGKKDMKKKNKSLTWIICGLGLLLIGILVFFVVPFEYEASLFYNVQEPYTTTEYYTEITSGKNCDYVFGCRCIHTSWWGLGACDSCECEKERMVTKYRTIQKERLIRETDTLFNMARGKTQYVFYE